MLSDLILVFWFFGPGGLANLAAFYSGKLPYLKEWSYPIDFHKKFRGKRIFGAHKTVRGFVVAVIIAIATVYLEIFLYDHFAFVRRMISLDYQHINPLLLGFLLGFGALAGDAVKSFFKRQVGIAPGKSWFPFDQIDYIAGVIVFTAFYIQLTMMQYILLCVMWFAIHPFSTVMGYFFKQRDEPL